MSHQDAGGVAANLAAWLGAMLPGLVAGEQRWRGAGGLPRPSSEQAKASRLLSASPKMSGRPSPRRTRAVETGESTFCDLDHVARCRLLQSLRRRAEVSRFAPWVRQWPRPRSSHPRGRGHLYPAVTQKCPPVYCPAPVSPVAASQFNSWVVNSKSPRRIRPASSRPGIFRQ